MLRQYLDRAKENRDRVADEAAAILRGRLPEYCVGHFAAPRWGWINKLAHASWEDLTSLSQKVIAVARQSQSHHARGEPDG
jgi:hypothetical protein